MGFYPFESYTIETKLKPEQIAKLISENTEPKKMIRSSFFGINPVTKSFEGTANESGFKINRIIRYRNSFLPVVSGTIQPLVSGCRIHIFMRMMIFVNILMFAWLGGTSFAAVMISIRSYQDPTFNKLILLGPFCMLVFFYLITPLSFKYESAKAKKFLNELLAQDKVK